MNEVTKKHVRHRAKQLGERGIRELLPAGLMTFVDSLGVDERALKPLNLTRMKEEL